MAETFCSLVDSLCWWTGAMVLGMSAPLVCSAMLWWLAGQVVRSARLWSRFYEAVAIMHSRRHRGAG